MEKQYYKDPVVWQKAVELVTLSYMELETQSIIAGNLAFSTPELATGNYL
jgi:hypothetical protein